MPAPIIAAYDPYTEDRSPVLLALVAAELAGTSVIVAAVYPWAMSEGWTDPEAFEGDTRRFVADSAQRLRDDLDVVVRIIADMSVPHALHALAREEEAGLLVVGSTARGRAGRVLAGSTAQRLLHGAPCPVALAPRGDVKASLGTIAVGFVDSPEGQTALAAALRLAARAGADVRVVAALHPSGGLEVARSGAAKPPRGIEFEGRHRAATEAALDRALTDAPAGVHVERELHVDDAADVLLRISEHVDLLVCGSRGYGPLRSVLLGGVSRRLVDEAACAVLVLPREARLPLEDLMGQAGAAAAR